MKLLKTISSFVLAVLVLLNSMGFYVDHMVCGMSGEHKLAINQSIQGCSDSCDPSGESGVKRTCCDYDSFYFKEDLPATKTENSTERFASAVKFIAFHRVPLTVKCAEHGFFHLLETPDVLPAVERHILLETYLI